MNTNMGNTDRLVRTGLAAGFCFLYAYAPLFSVFTLILIFTGGYLVGSSAIGYCPVYDLMGVSTCKSEKNQDD